MPGASSVSCRETSHPGRRFGYPSTIGPEANADVQYCTRDEVPHGARTVRPVHLRIVGQAFGLDSVLIAGTGSGKTMPFMLTLKYDHQATVLVVSPLKILQDDQVCAVLAMGTCIDVASIRQAAFERLGSRPCL